MCMRPPEMLELPPYTSPVFSSTIPRCSTLASSTFDFSTTPTPASLRMAFHFEAQETAQSRHRSYTNTTVSSRWCFSQHRRRPCIPSSDVPAEASHGEEAAGRAHEVALPSVFGSTSIECWRCMSCTNAAATPSPSQLQSAGTFAETQTFAAAVVPASWSGPGAGKLPVDLKPQSGRGPSLCP
ncbi:hypothetical protein MSAN_02428500 [Mycena sanguinolenta]|uniref:Uncharacterized protein n=1 Tax=Mycena sanguinolenta TaxID=230812 RepID=A0A8H6X2I0_9AGAR|nr:hypothetical protein MSAN_02428500 [Mycena sanguinolenta]